ncbi:MAG: hypothetical protein ACQEUN_17320 [Pseudomonadota bacterium]
MDSYQLPNRNRWDGWVTFAWIMVVLAIIGGIVLIAELGTMEVPERDFRGNVTWREEPNFVVWGAAIGQAVGAAMLAAIFSILNSTYHNSCDMLKMAATTGSNDSQDSAAPVADTLTDSTAVSQSGRNPNQSPKPASKPEKVAPHGLAVYLIERTSPFYHLLKPGYSICKANGNTVDSVGELQSHLKKGTNSIEFADHDGKEYSIRIRLNPEDLGVKFA